MLRVFSLFACIFIRCSKLSRPNVLIWMNSSVNSSLCVSKCLSCCSRRPLNDTTLCFGLWSPPLRERQRSVVGPALFSKPMLGLTSSSLDELRK